MEKFVNVGSISKDHIDPSIFCVLTAKSKIPNHSLTDLLIFSPRWDVASHTFRPPVSLPPPQSSRVRARASEQGVLTDGRAAPQFYHRNSATEFMGLVYGVYGGRSDEFQPGGASYETGFCPHGGRSPRAPHVARSLARALTVSFFVFRLTSVLRRVQGGDGGGAAADEGARGHDG